MQPLSFKSFNVVEDGKVGFKKAGEPAVKLHFTKTEMETAEQQAYARGLQEGQAAGSAQAKQENAEREQELATALRSMSGQLVSLILHYQNFLQQQRVETTKLALSVARKAAGQALEKVPMPEIEHLLSELLDMLVAQPEITITVKSDLQPLAKKRIEEALAAEGFKGTCTVKGEAAMPSGDCRIEWDNGKAERDSQALWTKIEEIVHQRFAVNSYITSTAGEPHDG